MVWKINRKHTKPYIALPELVVADNRKVSDTHTTAAASSGGAKHLTCRLSSARFVLSPRNSDGDNRAASPGWGGTAPSKSLIGLHRLETETTANTLATRSRIGHKQRTITAVSLGAWQRLSPDSETRTEIDSYRVGLKPPFNVKNGW
jgi:hypothetical protein